MGTEEKTLEDRLEELLEQETFSPPDEFRENANISDESIYDEADKDYEGFWEEQAHRLRVAGGLRRLAHARYGPNGVVSQRLDLLGVRELQQRAHSQDGPLDRPTCTSPWSMPSFWSNFEYSGAS